MMQDNRRSESLFDPEENDAPELYRYANVLNARIPPKELSLKQWFNEYAWPGMGLFGESYLLFSVGTLRPIWDILYPKCFSEEICSPKLLHSLTYNVVLGVICGMILLGTMANTIGRRAGSIATTSLMAFGAFGMTTSSFIFSSSPELLFQFTSILLFVFGVGVGGEYPLSASSASERAMAVLESRREKERQQQQHMQPPNQHTEDEHEIGRGQRVLLVFTMQGVGIFVNTLVLTVLLFIAGQYGNSGNTQDVGNDDDIVVEGTYDSTTLLAIWRTTYCIASAILVYTLVSRLQFLTESKVWAEDKQRRNQITKETAEKQEKGYHLEEISSDSIISTALSDNRSVPSEGARLAEVSRQHGVTNVITTGRDDVELSTTSLFFQHYGWRLAGSSSAWLLWDIAFYGNKLFQSSFILTLIGEDTTLLQLSAASALNSFIALFGYLTAAFIVDNPYVGRLRLQQWGFLITGTLFTLCGILYERLSSRWLMLLYFGSSFFGQCGPNATTFLIPAEIFPTEMRTMCHGIAAASGKVGALFAAIFFTHAKETDLFLTCGYASFGACIITFLTIPDTTTLDLFETDKKWRMILAGRRIEYNGPASKPEYMSFYERYNGGTVG